MKKFKMPSAFTILFIIIIIVAVLTFIIPAGAYDILAKRQAHLSRYRGHTGRLKEIRRDFGRFCRRRYRDFLTRLISYFLYS